MNLQTVLMCAQATARQQMAAFNFVGDDVQALIAEVESLLAPDPGVEETPVVEEVPAAE
jgi:hypothetical protein